MDRTDPSARRVQTAAQVLLGLLFLLLAYRAATQSITHDEALTWIAHVGGPNARPFEAGANNHVLFTQLARLSTWVLGAGDLALRLPTLLGAGLFLVSLLRLARRAFASPVAYAAAIGLTALNPYTLDFLVAARGYGLGLGLLLAALDQLHGWCRDRRGVRLLLAGAALGLSVAAQLTFLPLAAGLALALLAREACAPGPASARARSVLRVGSAVLLPALVAGGPWVAILALGMEPGELYGGVASLAESGRLLAERSLLHARDEYVPGRSAAVGRAVALAVRLLGPALLLALALGFVLALRRHRRRGAELDEAALEEGQAATASSARDLLLLAGGAAALVPLALVAAVALAPHLGMSFEYPDARRCVGYLSVLALAIAAWGQVGLAARGAARVAGGGLLALAVVLTARFAWQLETGWFADWRFDAGAKRIFARMAEHHRASGAAGPVRVAIQPWLYEPALNYYRLVNGATWLDLVERFPRLGGGGYAYFVVDPATDPEVAGALAEPLFHDPVSGVWLFARRSPGK